MKKAIIFLLIMALAFCFCGCSTGNQNTVSSVNIVYEYIKATDKYIEDGDLETAIKVLDEGVRKTGNQELKDKLDAVNKQFEEQKKAEEKSIWSENYARFMNEYISSATAQPINDYCLYDMNSDGVPELIFCTGTNESDYHLNFVTMIDKKATQIGNFSAANASVCGLEKENSIVFWQAHMDWERIEMLSMINNKVYSTVLLDIDHEIVGEDENGLIYKDYHGYRSLESIKMVPYRYGIERVEWESNPKDNNYEELKDLLKK